MSRVWGGWGKSQTAQDLTSFVKVINPLVSGLIAERAVSYKNQLEADREKIKQKQVLGQIAADEASVFKAQKIQVDNKKEIEEEKFYDVHDSEDKRLLAQQNQLDYNQTQYHVAIPSNNGFGMKQAVAQFQKSNKQSASEFTTLRGLDMQKEYIENIGNIGQVYAQQMPLIKFEEQNDIRMQPAQLQMNKISPDLRNEYMQNKPLLQPYDAKKFITGSFDSFGTKVKIAADRIKNLNEKFKQGQQYYQNPLSQAGLAVGRSFIGRGVAKKLVGNKTDELLSYYNVPDEYKNSIKKIAQNFVSGEGNEKEQKVNKTIDKWLKKKIKT